MSSNLYEKLYGQNANQANGQIDINQLKAFANRLNGDPQVIAQNLLQSDPTFQKEFQQHAATANAILGRGG